ncbi:MAG: hypothetical protein IPK72_20295 [Candidatus Eisenbacteria bacterium]|nr:hypothetical protein [Candidatus Eisenbacteria bacterium]
MLLTAPLAAAATTPPPDAPAADRLISGSTEFGVALYKEMAKTPGNIVVSPLSVLIATAMLDGAAEGETRTEIATGARFGVPETALHDELRELLDELATRVNHWAELSFANGLWVDRSCSMARSYQALLERSYDAMADTLAGC